MQTTANYVVLNDLVLAHNTYERVSSTFVILALGDYRLKVTLHLTHPTTTARSNNKAGTAEVFVFGKTQNQWNELFSIPIEHLAAYQDARQGVAFVKFKEDTASDKTNIQQYTNDQMGPRVSPILDFIIKQASTILL